MSTDPTYYLHQKLILNPLSGIFNCTFPYLIRMFNIEATSLSAFNLESVKIQSKFLFLRLNSVLLLAHFIYIEILCSGFEGLFKI